MKMVFMGSPEFAVPSLKILYESGLDIKAVITQIDRPKGRGMALTSPAVKIEAERLGLPVYQIEKVKDKGFIDLLDAIKLDIIAVVAYGQILPKAILDMPKYGCINLHGSLLPKYRGPAPIQWAVIKGERKTGVTTMFMDVGMDTGDILLQEEIGIDPEDTAGSLSKRLSIIGAHLLLTTINGLEKGSIIPKGQDHSLATYAPLLKKEDGRIDWGKEAEEIRNHVRGMNPWPGAYTYYEEKRLKVWNGAVLEGGNGDPGRIIKAGKDGLAVSAGKGLFLIKELQLEGKKRMSFQDFLQGHRVRVGDLLR